MPTEIIYGMRKKYEVENLPEIFRDVARELESKEDPPKYRCEDVENALRILEKKLKISISKAHTQI